MARLIYANLASVDGYVADNEGNFDWAEPDQEVHSFVNELEREVGTSLFGRRMYEVLSVWETIDVEGQPEHIQEYAEIWRGADKVVYSSTLEEVATARTRLERRFDPDAVRRMKAEAENDLAIGGPTLAAAAFRAGLVDQIHLFLTPIVVGGGTRALPDGVRLDLELEDERRFAGGMVFVRYRVSS